ncbi:MAG: ABC transporter permease [Lewinella sp.]|nr:ABC transporter permease [Lewinella sp.]
MKKDKKNKTPRLANWLLSKLVNEALLEEFFGDLQEIYQDRIAEQGTFKAKFMYWLDALHLLLGFTSLNLFKNHHPTIMFKHYFKITLRLFAKNKLYILINTLGLGIALSCCITAYLIFAYNLEFDDFHKPEKVARIFKIHSLIATKTGKLEESISAPAPLAPAAAFDVAGIDRYTRFIRESGFVQHEETGFRENIGFADSSFLEMFDFPLQYGSQGRFNDKFSIFLSAELAQKLFKDTDPTGTVLSLHFQNEKEIPVTVGGVFEKIPDNSTFYYDALMRFENYLDIHALKADNWSDWRDPSTFVELTDPKSADWISDQLGKYMALRNEAKQDVEVKDYRLESFHAKFHGDKIVGGYVNLRINTPALVVFGSLAAMILLIACFNLTNTSIAMSTKRLKEIGIRKTFGAARSQILSQFLAETGVIMAVSLLVGLIMAKVFIVPEFTSMLDFGFEMIDLNGGNLIFALVLIFIAAALLAGIYPALFNSRLHPVELVKGSVRIKGTNWLTRILTSSQFALTVIFLIAGVLFFQNNQFQENIGFGYDKDRLMVINIPGEKTFNILENRIKSFPKIREVAGSYSHVGYSSWQSPVEVEGQVYDIWIMGIGKNYFKTVGLNIVKGTDLNPGNDADLGSKVIVNQAFLDQTNLKDPLNRTVMMAGEKRQIVGIVEDHLDNFKSADVKPFLFYMLEPKQYQVMVINTKADDLAATFNKVEDTWHELFPNLPFDGRFQDDILLGGSRRTNTSFGKIFLFLTILGTFMSIAGIFSLASLNIARRTKEIGVRKVLGATKAGIVSLINREFVIILSVAAILGGLGGFFLTDSLMSIIYENHITVRFLPVILCAMLIFAAGYMTTAGSILKAAGANPVDTLRGE